jgi:predicted dehydrogenase
MIFNFGIIGAGLMGERRAKSLELFSQTNLIAVADINFDKAKDLAKKYDCCWYKDYLTLLNNPNINCVIISVINNQLFKVAKDALQHGKHILIEKPVAINLEDIDKLIELAESNNLIVKVGFNHRYLPTILKAKKLFDNKEIGELMFIKATYGQKSRIGFENEWRVNKEFSGGGELIDQGVHLIDLCRLFMGEIIETKGLATTLFWNIDVDDNDFFYLKNENNKIAFLHASSSLWENTFNFRIQGTLGVLEITGLRGHYGAPKLKLLKRNEEMTQKIGVYQFDEEIFEFKDEDNTWNFEMKNLLNAIENDEEINGSLIDAREVLKVVFDLYNCK